MLVYPKVPGETRLTVTPGASGEGFPCKTIWRETINGKRSDLIADGKTDFVGAFLIKKKVREETPICGWKSMCDPG